MPPENHHRTHPQCTHRHTDTQTHTKTNPSSHARDEEEHLDGAVPDDVALQVPNRFDHPAVGLVGRLLEHREHATTALGVIVGRGGSTAVAVVGAAVRAAEVRHDRHDHRLVVVHVCVYGGGGVAVGR